jgi:hypothetical protein
MLHDKFKKKINKKKHKKPLKSTDQTFNSGYESMITLKNK